MGKVRAIERKGSPVLVMIGISTHTRTCIWREKERETLEEVGVNRLQKL